MSLGVADVLLGELVKVPHFGFHQPHDGFIVLTYLFGALVFLQSEDAPVEAPGLEVFEKKRLPLLGRTLPCPPLGTEKAHER